MLIRAFLLPRVSGTAGSELVDRIGFVQPNKRVRFYQLNTSLGNDLLKHFETEQIKLLPEFIAMLKSHHALEADEIG